MEQRIAVLVSIVFGLLLVGIFASVARTAGQTGSPDAVAASAARWRRNTLWGLVLLFIPAIAYSLTRMPYSSGDATGATVVTATGTQWAWALSPTTVVAGRPVEIRVTSPDVNHGLGIYDLNNRLVAQTQAMPGYTNVIRHTFTTPGTYRILCLEYCGIGHHTMSTTLVVTAAQ